MLIYLMLLRAKNKKLESCSKVQEQGQIIRSEIREVVEEAAVDFFDVYLDFFTLYNS